MSETIRNHVIVAGVVQGVFFRSHTQRQANALGLAGWVRNLPDGRVEAVFEGSEAAVASAVAWCSRGPDRAIVTAVEVFDEDAEGLSGFVVRG